MEGEVGPAEHNGKNSIESSSVYGLFAVAVALNCLARSAATAHSVCWRGSPPKNVWKGQIRSLYGIVGEYNPSTLIHLA